jgi:hypothetical protein
MGTGLSKTESNGFAKAARATGYDSYLLIKVKETFDIFCRNVRLVCGSQFVSPI